MKWGPFPTQPMPEVFFKSRTHAQALSFIQHGIREHESFLLITGEYGLGKTLLCLRLMKAFHKNRGQYYFVYIPTANYTYEMMLQEMNKVLGFETTSDTRLAVLQSNLFDFYKKNRSNPKRFYVVIDDFQEIDSSTLNHLKLLANFNTEEGFFPFSLILFAHPMILDRLKPPIFASLQQKIKRHFRLTPFNYEETREYIYFRLLYSGARGKPFFTEEAVKYIYQVSKGNPRFINNICDASLMVGSKIGSDRIERKIVMEAAKVLAQNQKNEKFLASLRRSPSRSAAPVQRDEEYVSRPFAEERPSAPARRPMAPRPVERKPQPEARDLFNEPTAEAGPVDFTNISPDRAQSGKQPGLFGARPPNRPWGIESIWGQKMVRWVVWGLILVLLGLLVFRYKNILLGKISDQPIRYRIDRNYMDKHVISKSSLQRIDSVESSEGPAAPLDAPSVEALKIEGEGLVQVSKTRGIRDERPVSSSADPVNRKELLKARLLFRKIGNAEYRHERLQKGVSVPVHEKTVHGRSFYSLILSSHLNRGNAVKELSRLREGGLSPIFLKKISMHDKIWWVIFQGKYKTRKLAEEAKVLYHFTEALVRKVRASEFAGARVVESHNETATPFRKSVDLTIRMAKSYTK